MASADEIQIIVREVESVKLEKVIKSLHETTAGIGAALRILYECGGSTTSGQLCETLGVSTARVAVLLKTMVAKGLISKDKNVLDARVTVVSLTPFGEETVQKMRDEMYKHINRLIDHVGFKRLEEFIAISKEIAEIMKPPKVMY
jgi:DNA-binding MarR family transcriptional regulator